MKFPLITKKNHIKELNKLADRIRLDQEKLEQNHHTIKLYQSLIKKIEYIVEYREHIITKIIPKENYFYIIHQSILSTEVEIHLSIVYENGMNYDIASIYTTFLSEKVIFIDEIITKNVNHGYGTILMEFLIYFAQKKGVEKIIGKIVSTDQFDKYDIKHFDRMKHFYQKFGFEISNTQNSNFKQITLWIKKSEN